MSRSDIMPQNTATLGLRAADRNTAGNCPNFESMETEISECFLVAT